MNQGSIPEPKQDPLAFLSGGGEMGRLIRSMDWSETPLGPMESWPQSLRTAVSLCLASNFPIDIVWGPQRVQIYNDGYWPICGGKHPHSMGQDFRECWFSAWPAIGEAFDRALAGQSVFIENRRIFLDRNGYPEETFFTFSFSPIHDESGGVGGLFHPVMEMTQQTLAERRLKLLRDLADGTADAKTVEDACALLAQTLTAHPLDLPFVLLYLVNSGGTEVWLAGSSGLAPGTKASRERIDLAAGEQPDCWPLAEVARTGREREVDDLERRFGSLACGPYPEPPKSAFVLPINVPGLEHPLALLVAGVSSRRALDEPYRTFYALLRESAANALISARAYEEERKKVEALAELDRAKTAFFSNVSHEFRTPLTLMLGPVAELLAKGRTGLSPNAVDQLEVVNRNGQRLLRLVNTLLDFSRIEAGRVQAVYQPTDLAALTAELASVFRAAIERAGLRLTVHCPPLTEPVFVDVEMWEKIVLNLLSNAFKFTFEGEIAVLVRQKGNAVELRIRDTGTGIRDQDMLHLFERFYRVENARGRTHEGSGIGLALVQELLKLHGGTVAAESAWGWGTTFTVTLPLGSAHLPPDRIGGSRTLASTATGGGPYVEEALRWLPDEQRGAEDLSEAPAPHEMLTAPHNPPLQKANGNRPRVLVADDNADMRQYVVRLLADHYHVEAVPDGEAALAAARQRPPDLILTDVMMPRLDGFGLLRELRTDPRTLSLPVILLSARAGEESRIDGMEAGADDYLVKPFSARELLARVTAHLQMARLRREAAASMRAGEERFQAFMANSPATAYIKDAEGRYVFVNRLTEQQFKRPLAEWVGRTDLDIFSPEQAAQFQHNDRIVLSNRAAAQFVETTTQEDGLHYYLSLKFPLQDNKGNWLLAGMSLDMTEQKRTEALLAGQKRVLEMVATGRPLSEVLAAVVRIIEEQDPALLCAVLRLNGEGWRVRFGAKPGLPEYYMQGNNGFEIEPPYLSPCARVLHSGQEVVVPNIEADEQWPAQWRELALSHGLRSCRVAPVLASDGRVTAAFAMYSRQPSDPASSNSLLAQVATHLIGIAIERRHWQDALHRNEDRLRLIMESAKDYAIFTVDLAGRITAWNSGARNLLGYEAAEVIGRSADIVFTPEDRERGDPERELEKARTQGRAENERWHLRKDGSRFWASGLVMPLKGNENLLGFLKIMRDMTEQQQVAQRIQKAEERWRTMAEALPNLVWTDLPDGQCDWLSSQWGKYTGIPENELLGLRWLELVLHPDDRERTLACWRAACADQGDYDLEYRIRRFDGEYHWFKTRGVPVRDEQGKIIYWFGTCTDIEDMKRLEAELREADRRKNEFLATLAHELRNPLAPLRNGLQVMKLARDDKNAVEQARTMMERQLAQMVRLIDDLLDVSRISQGKFELRKERIDLATIVQQAVESSRPLIEAASHDLTIHMLASPIHVDADTTRMAQVIANLLNNAAKYTEQGGRISLTVEQQDIEVLVRVKDTGIGIPDQMLPKVFDIFTQVDRSLERSQGGLGIGLSLVKGLVEMHGGSVEARSEGHGMGSEFIVRLPVLSSSADERQQDENGERAAPIVSRRILVTDDNQDSATSLAMMLQIMGNDTRTAFDGLEALAVAEEFLPDVILLDIGMPRLNGYDAARRIREQPWGKNMVLVALTGWGQDEDRRRSQEASFDFHMVKPIQPSALEKLLTGVRVSQG